MTPEEARSPSSAPRGGDDVFAASWSTREARPTDETFLNELYADTRWDEVLGWGFPPQAARTFLWSQGQVQRRAYALQFPDARTTILLAADRAVGRLIVAHDLGALRIVDVSIVTEARGRGLGAWAISQVLARAAALDASVRLTATARGRARRLYQRLGFRDAAPIGQDGAVAMEWRAA